MLEIEQVLRETIGLDAASIGPAVLERAVRRRMKANRLKKLEEYKSLLCSSQAEWNELVESAIVKETWFFRDPQAFRAFVSLVRERWLPAHPIGGLRVLSLPCASGEEPSSLVMALLEAGLPPARFQIDASDISLDCPNRARPGIYRRNSFRGRDLAFRDRYFDKTNEGFVLNPEIRNRVHFYHDNLLAEDFLTGKGQYDFIFCRNLLIYFDRLRQLKTLRRIDRLLAPAGYLFVGPAELPIVMGQGFTSANLSLAFACQKTSQVSCATDGFAHPARLWKPSTPVPPRSSTGHSQLETLGRENAVADGAGLGSSRQPGLETVLQLAIAGQLEQAAKICESHLSEKGASAEAYYLLGLVRETVGDPSAIDCYRKALYLEPEHYKTLLQMALLAQKSGDLARARTFKKRAERVEASNR